LCLCGEAIRRWVKEYRLRRKKQTTQQNLLSSIVVDATGEDKQAIIAGVAPERLLRKATLQNVGAPGARNRGKSEGGPGEGIEMADAKKDNFNALKAPPSPRGPDQTYTVDNVAVQDPAQLEAPVQLVVPQGTADNDPAFDMLQQDWENDELNGDEEDDDVAPLAEPAGKSDMTTPDKKTGDDLDLGEEESIEEPNAQKRAVKRQSELNL